MSLDQFKDALNTLIHAYLAVVDSVARQPLIKIGRANVTEAQDGQTPAPKTALTTIIQGIREGELPSIGVMRYVMNLFVSYHIKTRLEDIRDYLQFQELRSLVVGPEDKTQTAVVQTMQTNLAKLEGMLSSGVKIKLLLILAPAIPVVTWALDFFEIKGNIAAVSSISLPVGRRGLVYFGGLTLVWLLGIVSSSFVAKRRIMLRHGVYKLERRLFKTMSRPRPYELPLDVVGWILLMGSYFFWYFSILSDRIRPSTSVRVTVIVCFGTYCLVFGYAFFKRVKLQQW